MSRLREINWKKRLMELLTALLLASGITMSTAAAVFPGWRAAHTAMVCALCCAAVEVLLFLPVKRKGLLLLLPLLPLAVWGVLGGGPVHTLIQTARAILYSQGAPLASSPYADAARAALCFGVSLLSVLIACDQSLTTGCTVVLGAAILCYFAGAEQLLLLLPAFAGLLLLAVQGWPRAAALPVALLLAALAFLLLPPEMPGEPPLKQAVTEIRDLVEDYLFFNRQRTSFSLATEGFKPEEKRLGGAPEIREHEVMEVETGETLHLRGCAYDAYSGLDWYDTLSERRYLYASIRQASLRQALFDLKRPPEGMDGAEEKQVRVRMLEDATTTLFLPQRTRSIRTESDRMVLYFNTATEVFITRDLQAGDAYSLSYLSYSPKSRNTRALVDACADVRDEHYAEVAEDYLKLPDHIQQEIKDIAVKATRGCETPLEKALALQNYLKSNYRYSLNVKTPPEDVDFTAWFLLGEKKGYCTYFATAMTVLSRLCGLPARYVTGYLAIPDENGKALVTSRNAHAWTEIYFNGFGWLEFDATPGMDDGPDPGDSGPQPPDNAPTPTPAPTSTPMPTPTPTPMPENAPEATPTPTPTPEPEAPPVPPSPKDDPETPRPPFPWVLLAFLMLVAALLLRFLATEPLRRAAKKPDQAVAVLFGALISLLALRRVKRVPQETLLAFGLRADEAVQGMGLPAISPLTEAYAAQLYGKHPADAEPFRQAYRAYRKQAGLPGRLRLALKRMFSRQKPQKQR